MPRSLHPKDLLCRFRKRVGALWPLQKDYFIPSLPTSPTGNCGQKLRTNCIVSSAIIFSLFKRYHYKFKILLSVSDNVLTCLKKSIIDLYIYTEKDILNCVRHFRIFTIYFIRNHNFSTNNQGNDFISNFTEIYANKSELF